MITGRAAWNSQAPPNFKRIAATPSYVLWEADRADARGPPRPARGDRGRRRCAGCASPEIRILLANPGRASLFPDAVVGQKGDWDEDSVLGTGEESLADAASCRAGAGTSRSSTSPPST